MEWRDLPPETGLSEPPGLYQPPGEPAAPAKPRFVIEPWSAIAFESREEWAIKRLLPRQGLAVFYGKVGSFKSFITSHLALCVALDWEWAGRRVAQAPVVYIAAEGAAGLRKRKAGFAIAHPELPADVPFALISGAPNFGAMSGDLPALVSAIEGASVAPRLIVIDTLAQTLGAGDENGTGMTAFVANAGALASHFEALVLIVHHVGLGDDRRMRGHSSLNGALDAVFLCERREGELAATLTLQKLKDEASDVRLEARLSRVVIAHDDDGDEISTLVVDSIEDAELQASAPRAKSIPRSQSLLVETIKEAIDDAGESFKPFGASGPLVRGVDDGKVRERYYSRIAEIPKDDDTPKKLADRQRQAFNSAIKRVLDAKLICAAGKDGRRFLWLP